MTDSGDLVSSDPQPVRGDYGGPVTGPRDVLREREQPDLFAPPLTDSGLMPNLKFSFSDAHNKLCRGGWTREVTMMELPVARDLAGVQMHLNAGNPSGAREMHWHVENEWQIMLQGSARVTLVDAQGRTMAADINEGDLWYFPAGLPHSIQAHEGGCEFLLVFDDGAFSEDKTFMLTDWLRRTPRDVLAKNFGVAEADLAPLPDHELYIFEAPAPPPLPSDDVAGPAGVIPDALFFRPSEWDATEFAGGRVLIVDSSNFPASKTIATAIVEVEPGGMRELHWHPNADEWQYYIQGEARMTVFNTPDSARTFSYRAGDVGYVPKMYGHYVENIGNTPLRFLEMFKSDHFADVSLTNWLALTPPELVQAHLGLSDATMAVIRKGAVKPVIVGANPAAPVEHVTEAGG